MTKKDLRYAKTVLVTKASSKLEQEIEDELSTPDPDLEQATAAINKNKEEYDNTKRDD